MEVLDSFMEPSHASSDLWRSAADAAGTTVSTREVSEKSVLVVREWPGSLGVDMIECYNDASCKVVHFVQQSCKAGWRWAGMLQKLNRLPTSAQM